MTIRRMTPLEELALELNYSHPARTDTPTVRKALAERAREVWRDSMADHGLAPKARVFSENDVRGWLGSYVAACVEHGVVDADQAERLLSDGPVSRSLASAPSELTEEVIARSAADRLVALALTWGAWDYEGIPQAVWEKLFEDKLVRQLADPPGGEAWPVLTDEGEAFLRAELERDR